VIDVDECGGYHRHLIISEPLFRGNGRGEFLVIDAELLDEFAEE
tara:strand:- start:108 stop:239 length:132 start_codon:yes stop_codon:yes gene_type:complete